MQAPRVAAAAIFSSNRDDVGVENKFPEATNSLNGKPIYFLARCHSGLDRLVALQRR